MDALRRSLVVALAATLAFGLPACGSGGVPNPVPRVWVIQAGYADIIRYRAPDLARRIFAPPSVVLGETLRHPLDAFAWPSYAWFQSEVHQTGAFAEGDSRSFLRPLRTALYDPEGWSSTPLRERLDPTAYFRRFAELAHAHRWTVVITPDVSLMSVPGAVCGAQPGESMTDAYLRCRIVAAAARFADVVETQAQREETNPGDYRSFVARTAAQARASNPHVLVIAGLTTGRDLSAEQMYAAWNSVRDLVDGYYLSIAGNSRVGTALQFLRMLPSDASPSAMASI